MSIYDFNIALNGDWSKPRMTKEQLDRLDKMRNIRDFMAIIKANNNQATEANAVKILDKLLRRAIYYASLGEKFSFFENIGQYETLMTLRKTWF